LSGEDHESVKLVWSPSAKEAVLLSDDLAPPPDGRTYELWTVAGGDTPARAAVFRPDDDGTLRAHFPADMRGVDLVGVSVEPSGGSATPASPHILSTAPPRSR